MCGRFVLNANPQAIQETFDLLNPPPVQARYNIAPTQPVLVITNDNPREATFQRWGLIPSWAKDPSIGNTLINARGETLEEKPSFRTAFKRRRCLIPATGFYEWQKNGKHKTPMYVHLPDDPLFAFAGLWEIWHSPEGDRIDTCTIITTEPNEKVQALHHRMALILKPEDYDVWLDNDAPSDILKALIKPYPSEAIDFYEVSPRVNKPDYDAPDLIMPVNAPSSSSGQLSMF
jgi:putative SOS response-associated peptidase YedK